jgi:hypothetical protein
MEFFLKINWNKYQIDTGEVHLRQTKLKLDMSSDIKLKWDK